MKQFNSAAIIPLIQWAVLGEGDSENPNLFTIGTPDGSRQQTTIVLEWVEGEPHASDLRMIAEAPVLYAFLCQFLNAFRAGQFLPNPEHGKFDERAFKMSIAGMEQVQRRIRGFQEN